jgi:predicted secreted Zn-dependent protease
MSSFTKLIESMRKEPRLLVALPVKVYFAESSREFQMACTYEISYKGARLAQVKGITQVGQEVWVQRQMCKAKYKVVWVGKDGTEQQGQVGLECVEPEEIIWEKELVQRLAKP